MIHAVERLHDQDVVLNSAVTVVDVLKCKMYLKNFGEFFKNQVEAAGTIILSRTDLPKATDEKVETAISMIRELNPDATIITTPVEQLEGKKILDTIEGKKTISPMWRKSTRMSAITITSTITTMMRITIMTIIMSMTRTAPAAAMIMTTSIITTMTIMTTSIITTMTIMTTSIIMSMTTIITSTIMSMTRTAPAAVTIMTIITTIIMPMRSSPAGAKRPFVNSAELRSRRFLRRSPRTLLTA